MTSSLLTSPTIAALRAQLADGNIAVLDQFWQHIADHGAPIIEPITNDADHALVTFVWRGDPNLKHVVVIGGIAGEDTVGNELLCLFNTDVWYRTYRARNDTRTTYFFSPNDPLVPMTDERWEATWLAWVRGGHLRIDPFNANVLWSEESILTLPSAPPEAWLASQPDVPADTVDEHRFQSTLLENERTVWVYRPPGFNPHQEPYGWALFFDGDGYRYVPTPTILDNLIAAGRIPPLVAIFVANASYEERRQALSCNRQFNRFLIEELLPWARPRYHLTDDPQRTIVVGASYGGLAATYAAFQHPHIFGNVLAQSGAFYWRQGQDRTSDPGADTDWNWLIRQLAAAPHLPLRFHLDVGIYETDLEPWGADTNTLSTSRHMHDVLHAKGYAVDYVEFSGAHDFVGWRGALPDALTALVGKQ